MDELLLLLDPSFHCLSGDHVLELKPRRFDKAQAMQRFMTMQPFLGRQPFFIGDDLSDLSGFDYVERIGGESIAVGDRVKARGRLADPAALRGWLRRFANAGTD
jgi:trehalose 6-phosphate phosphatase